MKPAWDQLAAEFDGDEVIIGDVDCTVILPAQGLAHTLQRTAFLRSRLRLCRV